MKTIATALFLGLLLGVFAAEASGQTITITNTVPTWTQGRVYVGGFATSVNGIPTIVPPTYTITAGALPNGLALGLGGVITGTPTVPGPHVFTVMATVPLVGSASQQFTMTINPVPQIVNQTLPAGEEGKAYAGIVQGQGGTAPLGYLVTAGVFPPGLSLSPTTGAITGQPTTAGGYSFTVTISDFTLATASQAYSVVVTAAMLLTPDGTTTWTVNRTGFDLRIVASGGDGTFTFDAPTGVPAGITTNTLSDRILFSGTPTETGANTIRVAARDGSGAQAIRTVVVSINAPPRILTDTLPGATVGADFGAMVETTNGTRPFVFRILAPGPTWLGIESDTGKFNGTPTETGLQSVDVEVRDVTGATTSRGFSFRANEAPELPKAILAIGLPGRLYETTLPVTGGSVPFTGSVEIGKLPDGLSLNGAMISGTPTASGYERFTARLMDLWGAAAEQEFELTIGKRYPVKGKIISETIDAQGLHALVFDVLAGTLFSLKLKVGTGTRGLVARMARMDGSLIDVTPNLKVSRKNLRLKQVPIEDTGRVAVLLANANDDAGIQYAGSTNGKPQKTFSGKVPFGPLTQTLGLPFSALARAELKVQVKSAGKSVPGANYVELIGPNGLPVNVDASLKETDRGFKISKFFTPAGGDYILRLRPDGRGTADGILKVKITAKTSKRIYEFTVD